MGVPKWVRKFSTQKKWVNFYYSMSFKVERNIEIKCDIRFDEIVFSM